MSKLRVLDLFAGIGGFSLGLEATDGFETIAFCEKEPFCRKVLARHWPAIRIFDDVTKLCRRVYDCEPEGEDGEVLCQRCGVEFSDCDCIGTDQFLDEIGQPDIITAGVPCQPVSQIGKQLGECDERWLWPDAIRILRELEPSWAIFENPIGIKPHLEGIIRGLSDIGYDAWWDCLPACAVGAPHIRKRVFIVAHANSKGLEGHAGNENGETGRTQPPGYAPPSGVPSRKYPPRWWDAEPAIQRVAHGVQDRVDRLRAIGNAVVPQVVAEIGRAILEIEGRGAD